MPIPRRRGRRTETEADLQPFWEPPSPLASIALVVTLLAAIAAGRTWWVHRPQVDQRLAAAEAAMDEMGRELVTEIRRLGPTATLEEAAARLGRIRMFARQWQDEILPTARFLDRAEAELSPILEQVPPAARAALRNLESLQSLSPEVAATPGMPDAATWDALRSQVQRVRTPAVRTAEAVMDQFAAVPSLRRSASRGDSLAAATLAAGGAVLSDQMLEAVRSELAAADAARMDRRRLTMRMLGLALAAAAVWLLVRVGRGAARSAPIAPPNAAPPGGRNDPVAGSGRNLVIGGGILLASRLLVEPAVPGAVTWGIVEIAVLHMAAATLVPWASVRDSALPILPLLAAWGVAFLIRGVAEPDQAAATVSLFDRVVIAMLSPLVLVPGAMLAGWRIRVREERRSQEQLRGRMTLVDDELSRARTIHDAMFPSPFEQEIGFEYTYEPNHEIGGDYVHLHQCRATGAVTITLLDVAGHGLAAALTVNRLYGELERIFAEDAAATPEQVMGLLNRYIHLTMSRHSMFATGTCMRLNPTDGELRWVSAGHPPSLLRRADGSIQDLQTTTILLGALGSDEFESVEERLSLAPGDVVIAYTDGAFEARNAAREQFGIPRLRDLAGFDTPPRIWSRFIAGAVQDHHGGAADDDVLIATLTLRSLRIGGRA
jgi:serine phosphatase RsbU (regulator of sigma subunit)